MNVADLNYFLATATIGLQLVTVILLFVFLMRKRVPSFNDIAQSVGEKGLWIGFGAAAVGTVMAVYYSDILGFDPCYWCYWQRIFLFPQAVLLGMAAWNKDIRIANYSLVLSALGALVALYHHLEQTVGEGVLPCPATGGVSCAHRVIFEYGYITFPLMAFTTFAFLIVVMFIVRSKRALDA